MARSTEHLFPNPSASALRQPRTDRLILRRLRASEGEVLAAQMDDGEIARRHEIIRHWAKMESSGSLVRQNESQLESEFIHHVFGEVLGYKRIDAGENEQELWPKQSFGQNTPDLVIGKARSVRAGTPAVVVELKGPRVHPDRDRSNGRTAVQQLGDYFGYLPKTRWGIICNMVSFRLYDRDHTRTSYEHFTLQDIASDLATFREFLAVFGRTGLLEGVARQKPAAERLLADTDKRQRTVGDELFERYREQRIQLIRHLHKDLGYELDESINAVQVLLDRIMFIAFCEDRELLPDETLKTAYRNLPPYSKATNPIWENFLDLFRAIDKGNEHSRISGYNGGLFRKSLIDTIDLSDEWTKFFSQVGTYDFRDEINLDVLGHLFEKSLTELEKLREGDLFGQAFADGRFAEMPKSAIRKRYGIYYTPPEFTAKIAELTVDSTIADRFAALAKSMKLTPAQADDSRDYWRACLKALETLRVVDPACGSGAFLFQAYEVLESRYAEVLGRLSALGDPNAESEIETVPDRILQHNLYGVDLSLEAVEITQLALWIKSARRGKTLSDLSHNIRRGNSLIRDPEIDEHAFDWNREFPEVFKGDSPGFDCVIGNPPWERMKLQEREYFALSAPPIATASNAAKRRKMIEDLRSSNPDLLRAYIHTLRRTSKQLDYCRSSGLYPLTATGDINTYAVFVELATTLVSASGRVGMLVPSGIATDKTTMKLFATLLDENRLASFFDFENKKPVFPDVHRSFKFAILEFGGANADATAAEFVFFARRVEEISDKSRHIRLSAKDIELVNPNTRTCPIFRTNRDAELTKAIYRRVPVLIRRRGRTITNDWGVSFLRMFDQTNDAELFAEADELRKKRYTLDGNRFTKGQSEYLPVYEAKMVQAYDHRAASVMVELSNWMRQGQTEPMSESDHADPNALAVPRYWVKPKEVSERLGEDLPACMGFKDISSATNQRTMIASFVPAVGFTNHFVLIRSDRDFRYQSCLLGNLNTYVFDFVTRQKLGSITLNYFIVEQLPTLPPHAYDTPCPWEKGTTLLDWISGRVLKLSCTATDMIPLAKAAEFKGGDALRGRVNRWKAAERATLRAELDAAYFHLYGVEREDAEYMLSTFQGHDQPVAGLPGRAKSASEFVLDTYDWLAASRR